VHPAAQVEPEYIGSAWIAASQRGDAESRFRATVYDGLSASGLRVCARMSFALICVSVSANRTFTPTWSTVAPEKATPAFLSVSSTRPMVAVSTLSVALALDTCTAGDSPKKFGSV
jgi:hypothetical protein